MNVNYKSDELLIETIINKGFEEYWNNEGKCKTINHFHINYHTFDRCMKLANLEETKEHKLYIRNKNRKI